MRKRSASRSLADVGSPIMGTKVVLILCFMVITSDSGKTENVVTKIGLSDNISAESVSRLYRNVPEGVYASAAPYSAYSFQVPSVLASKNIPVKEETILVQNSNGFLKDSYGNKYLQTPQALAYRTIFPRQFVQLQNLPAHLSQPLVSTNSQFKQVTPHFFAPSQYNLQSIQSIPQSTLSRYTLLQQLVPGPILNNQYQTQAAQQQSTANKNIYSNSIAPGKFNNLQSVPKFQRLQDATPVNYHNIEKNPSLQETAQTDHSQQLQQAPKQTIITTLSNGQKISVNLVTKPPLPLLDLNLLQPLTFANPVVPQVQHYLPRINEQTYSKIPNVNVDEVKTHQMEFVVQRTKSYDSEDKPKDSKKKVNNVESDEEIEHINSTSSENEHPEFSYEINSPNYKETYTEQKIKFNKETESEPQTYTYESKSEDKPVHYSYEKNTQKKPIVVSYEHHIEKVPIQHNYEDYVEKKPVHYTSSKTVMEPHHHTTKNTQSPKHLIFNIKPEERVNFEQNKGSHQHSRENSKNNSEESDDNKENLGHDRNKEKNHGHHVRYVEPSKNTHQTQPEEKQVQYYHTNNQQDPNIVKHYHVPQLFINQVHKNLNTKQREQENFQPIVPEYEENIELSHPQKENDEIRVDPNQHIQSPRTSPSPPQNHPVTSEYLRPPYSAAPVVKGKPEAENNEATDVEEQKEPEPDTYTEPENSEENFEKSYKDAAYGFAAYDTPRDDGERDIYNPESYGVPRYYSEYNIEKSPFKQYESESDDFPKFTRTNYKDERDKMHEDYYLDFAVSKPTSLRDSFRNKENYYKMYKKNKPENYYTSEDDDKKQNAKYTSIPSYEFYFPKQHLKKQNDYSSEKPRDTSAHATRPLLRYKSRTQFVEPQFQYGFEPISIPQLLDSELAAMASNNNLKSEKQGTRKKIYKENFHIKKTSTKGGKRISR